MLYFVDFNLKWASHSVSAIGVTFTTLSGEVIKLNYESQLEKIYNLLKIWQRRELSLTGKTTIIKSLAISYRSLFSSSHRYFESGGADK